MFKQQNELYHEKNKLQHPLNYRQKQHSLSRNRNHHLGIKLVTHSTDENKPNLHNEVQNPKNHQTSSRNSSVKGIQVVSSRQSSHERRQLATSRTHQRQKQSRQIKSQSNISQFKEKQSKEVSIERIDKSVNEMQEICLLYQQKFKQAILKNNSAHQLQLDSLKEIISSNEERINNLITTINYMAEKEQKTARATQKLQQRLQSIVKYQDQCHEYTLRRLQSLQTIYLTIGEQLQRQIMKGNLQYSNRFGYIELIVKDIFLAQRESAKQQFRLACQQLNKFHMVINEMDLKINLLSSAKNSMRNFQIKQQAIIQHIKQFNISLKLCNQRLQVSNQKTGDPISLNDIQTKINKQLLSLQSRINQLEINRNSLQKQYQSRQQKAKKTIFEMSTLLYKIQRQLEAKRKEGQQLSRYNLEIENKLIETRIKENSMKIEVDSFHKHLETSKRQEHDLLSKEKDVFKEKFEEMFKQNEYLQGLNCKNKYLIIQKQKDIVILQQKLDQKDQQISRLILSNSFLTDKVQRLTQSKLQDNRLKIQNGMLRNQVEQMCGNLTENSRQITCLSVEIKKLYDQGLIMKRQNEQLSIKLTNSNKQFNQEQLYSEHLQHENQELENSLNNYKEVFENQSLIFKQTIQNLQLQNVQLKKTVQAYTDKQRNYKFQTQSFKTQKGNKNTNKFQKIVKLKNVLEKMKYVLPVPCEVDSSGYLKLHDKGTYVLDEQENAFEMTEEELRKAGDANIINLFQ